jgi:mannose/fructose/N-acetylgalactosamine-specific phosphotransferase system component IIB
VANNEIAAQTMQRTLMAAAVPKSIRVVIASLVDVAALFAGHELDAARVLLLMANPGDALAAYRGGVPFKELNLGNLHCGDGKLRYSCTVALDQSELDNLRQLEAEGVRIAARCIPSDPECDWKKLLEGGGK